MLIQLKDGRVVSISRVESEKPLYKLVTGKETTRYSLNNYILSAYYDSKNIANYNIRRPTTVHGNYYSRHVGEIGYFVSKKFRGSGLSYFMMFQTAQTALNKGIKITLISTTPDNKASIALFENCGGKRAGLIKNVLKIKGKYIDSIWMESTTENLIKKSRSMWHKKGVKIVKK